MKFHCLIACSLLVSAFADGSFAGTSAKSALYSGPSSSDVSASDTSSSSISSSQRSAPSTIIISSDGTTDLMGGRGMYLQSKGNFVDGRNNKVSGYSNTISGANSNVVQGCGNVIVDCDCRAGKGSGQGTSTLPSKHSNSIGWGPSSNPGKKANLRANDKNAVNQEYVKSGQSLGTLDSIFSPVPLSSQPQQQAGYSQQKTYSQSQSTRSQQSENSQVQQQPSQQQPVQQQPAQQQPAQQQVSDSHVVISS